MMDEFTGFIMNISLIIATTAFASAIITSLAASGFHRMSWHTRIRKSKFAKINLFISNLYQFNYHFYNPFSFIRELMFSALYTALIYKYLIYDECSIGLECIFANLATVVAIRLVMQGLFYAKFYDRNLSSE